MLLGSFKNRQQLRNVCYFTNSEPYELYRIAEHCSPETDLTADGDKWALAKFPIPSWGNKAAGGGPGEGDSQSRGDFPNEQKCVRFEIPLPDTDSSMETAECKSIFLESAPFLWCHLSYVPYVNPLGHKHLVERLHDRGRKYWILAVSLSRATRMRSSSDETTEPLQPCSAMIPQQSVLTIQLPCSCLYWKCKTRDSWSVSVRDLTEPLQLVPICLYLLIS